jgi:NADPH2:quinone reductase
MLLPLIPRSFDNNFKLIKRKGTIVSVGNASGAVPPFSLPRLVEKNIKLLRPTWVFPRITAEGVLTKILTSRMANYVYTPEEAAYYGQVLFGLIEHEKLGIQIFDEYPFTAEGVQRAQTDLTVAGGKTTGKLLIKVA